MNIKHTVFGYASSGMSGIMIKDQVPPQRCVHVYVIIGFSSNKMSKLEDAKFCAIFLAPNISFANKSFASLFVIF